MLWVVIEGIKNMPTDQIIIGSIAAFLVILGAILGNVIPCLLSKRRSAKENN